MRDRIIRFMCFLIFAFCFGVIAGEAGRYAGLHNMVSVGLSILPVGVGYRLFYGSK